jgi:hypothetical protein
MEEQIDRSAESLIYPSHKFSQMGMSLTQVDPRSSMRRWWKSIHVV